MFRHRGELFAGFAARAVEAARGGDQFLQLLGTEKIELAVDDTALERGGEPCGIGRCAVAGRLGGRRRIRPPARRNFAVALAAGALGGLRLARSRSSTLAMVRPSQAGPP